MCWMLKNRLDLAYCVVAVAVTVAVAVAVAVAAVDLAIDAVFVARGKSPYVFIYPYSTTLASICIRATQLLPCINAGTRYYIVQQYEHRAPYK